MQQEEKKEIKLDQRFLGNTGVLVSELCLGTMTFSVNEGMNAWGMPVASEETSHALLDRFVAAGGNFIDTADIYDKSEEVVGRWLERRGADKRKDVVLATKVRGATGMGPNDAGLSRKHILDGIERSLKALKTDYIDLYQCHNWDAKTPLRETLSTLNDLVRIGKVRYIGLSNFTGWQLQKAIDMAQHMGWEPVVSLQTQYNLLCRETEWELLQVCKNEGLAVLPWSPLKGGWLTGKFTRETMKAPEAGSRVEWAQKAGWEQTDFNTLNNEHTWNVIDKVKEIAKQTNKSASQVGLRWLLEKPVVTSPIIGARTMAHLEDNLGAAGWTLTQEQVQALDDVSAINIPYPWGMYWVNQRNPPARRVGSAATNAASSAK